MYTYFVYFDVVDSHHYIMITLSLRKVSNTLTVDGFLDSSAQVFKIQSHKNSTKPCTTDSRLPCKVLSAL